jgi:opacity protein-like surface antigen
MQLEKVMQRTAIALAMLALSAAASASEFDYTYLSIGYGNVELDEVDVDGDGFGFSGSYALTDSYHLFAGYEMTDFDYDVEGTSMAVGFGFNTGLSPRLDLVTRLSYQYVEVELDGFGSEDENGLGLGVGLRFAATPALELDAGIDYVDLGDSGDETALGVGGLYSFTESFALGLGGSWSDDASSYSVSGRFYFGR